MALSQLSHLTWRLLALSLMFALIVPAAHGQVTDPVVPDTAQLSDDDSAMAPADGEDVTAENPEAPAPLCIRPR